MLYHASNIEGLERLTPHISTHGKPYVYAIRSRLMAILFGTPKDDFDILIDSNCGKAILYECYPLALEKIYSGKSCSLYTVEEENFQNGLTGWDEELVCSTPVAVISEEKIDDIYSEILRATKIGDCEIHFYEQSEDYLSFLRDELQERIVAFGIDEKYRNKDIRFIKYHNQLLEEK